MMYPEDTICAVAQGDTPRTIRYMDWIRRAKERMRDLGLRQEDLKTALGVKTRGAVGHYFNNRRQLSADQAAALSAKLGMSIDALFGDESASQKEQRRNQDDVTQPIENKPSQATRFDLRMIGNAAWALGEAFAAKGLPFRLEEHQEYFLQVYQACLDLVDLKTPGHTAKILDLAKELADKAGGWSDGRGDQVPSTGIHQEDVARRVRRK